MLKKFRSSIVAVVRRFRDAKIPIKWIKQDRASWLSQHLPANFIKPAINKYSKKIESLAQKTNEMGPQPLWEGYVGNNVGGSTRMPDGVRTAPYMGNFYSSLVEKRKPSTIVEFGAAFGVSGMYFLAGIEANREGKLFTFEPNAVWARIAENNLSQISDRFVLTIGTFEDNVSKSLGECQRIDLAFIDAIHTKEFVVHQLDIVVGRSDSRSIIILDDINFSDNMAECWSELSSDDRFIASATLGKRVGLLEVR